MTQSEIRTPNSGHLQTIQTYKIWFSQLPFYDKVELAVKNRFATVCSVNPPISELRGIEACPSEFLLIHIYAYILIYTYIYTRIYKYVMVGANLNFFV